MAGEEGAEVRARPHPQAEDDLELPVWQLRSVLGTPKLQAVANKARRALFSKCSLQPLMSSPSRTVYNGLMISSDVWLQSTTHLIISTKHNSIALVAT